MGAELRQNFIDIARAVTNVAPRRTGEWPTQFLHTCSRYETHVIKGAPEGSTLQPNAHTARNMGGRRMGGPSRQAGQAAEIHTL